MDLLDLNEEQKRAVTHEEGPLLVMAGAGSGKTRVLIHRTAWLIKEKGVNPGEIALLTFTNKAAAEMKARAEKISEGGYSLGFAGTFHTFCARLMRTWGPSVGVDRNFVIYDSDDSESLMKQIIKDKNLDPKENRPRMYLALISRMKNDLVTVIEQGESAKDSFYKQVNMIWREYQRRLTQNMALDFDDLLVKTVDLLKIDRVRETLHGQYKWILVDEYQDVNKAQFVITKLLAGHAGNLTAVGDAAQAIYSFRGADFRNLLLLEGEYPGLKTVSLPQNYRSTQNILDAAYGVISHNTTHPVIKLATNSAQGDLVDLYEAADERDEARYVVGNCQRIAAAGNEAVVLYRTNAQSRAFEDELIKRSLPYKLIGGLRFYNRLEIKDLLAYLRLLVNEKDEVSVMRVLKIGKRRYYMYVTWRGNLTKEKREKKPGVLLEEIINETAYLNKYDERDEEDRARIENINELLAVASEFTEVRDFLENAALSESEEKAKSSGAKITLMTVHAAKGLEFDNVFVVGLEEGLFPHSRTLMEKEEIEEERRLMYVAMTRARKKLTISFARSRLVFGGRTSSFPSRFLSEIPEHLLKRAGKGIEEFMREAEDRRGIDKRNKESREKDEWGEPKRKIVQDWEIEAETKDDFAEVDNW